MAYKTATSLDIQPLTQLIDISNIANINLHV
jgi:hypothetical protein